VAYDLNKSADAINDFPADGPYFPGMAKRLGNALPIVGIILSGLLLWGSLALVDPRDVPRAFCVGISIIPMLVGMLCRYALTDD